MLQSMQELLNKVESILQEKQIFEEEQIEHLGIWQRKQFPIEAVKLAAQLMHILDELQAKQFETLQAMH